MLPHITLYQTHLAEKINSLLAIIFAIKFMLHDALQKNHSIRFMPPNQKWGHVAFLFASVLALQVGCWSEVAFEPVVQKEEEGENANQETNDPVEAALVKPPQDSESDPQELEEPTDIEPVEDPKPVIQTEDQTTEEATKPVPPWMRDDKQPSELSGEAARYFGGARDTAPSTETNTAISKEEAEDEVDDLIAMLQQTEIASTPSIESSQPSKPAKQTKPEPAAPEIPDPTTTKSAQAVPQTNYQTMPPPTVARNPVGSRYGSVVTCCDRAPKV